MQYDCLGSDVMVWCALVGTQNRCSPNFQISIVCIVQFPAVITEVTHVFELGT